MTPGDIHKLFAFNHWANQRVLDAVSDLPASEFSRERGGSFGSIRGTMLHIMWGELRWLRFWQDGGLIPQPPESDYPDLASIREAWSGIEQERQAFARRLTQAVLDTPRTVHEQDFTLAELIQHVVNHSTYHRGQIALYLRQVGRTPPPTDYRLFLSQGR